MKAFAMSSIFLVVLGSSGASRAMSSSPSEVTSDEMVFCAADAQACPDGSYVSRDPKNECKFRPCPSEKRDKPKAEDSPSVSPVPLDSCTGGAELENGHECP